ncbi:MAG: quinone-modifying oxidoreductase subunit A [Candidatus Desulfovibrio kirbyi]|uniref:Quinone-modifying oxidoreductase subunit A n=1 Tax=Candidatus Desulfovibrio kirbyi TaxID=2696086 RepID=A0A6L2R4X1_9BACT|nr:MAG: quinone-modifying oxidoreductase subunit A [Candidatus Desulfovibrio kirbyi]
MSKAILVVGGGFAGLTAAIEAAELGHDVFIIEKSPWLGGRVAQLNKYFPKLCPPSCGLEIQFQRIRKNPRVKFFTLAEVTGLSGSKGNYTVTVRLQPRYTAPHSVDFSLLASSLVNEVDNDFDFGLSKRKALYKSMPFAFPDRYALDAQSLSKADVSRIADANFLNMTEQAREIELDVAAIVVTTGWKPYDVTHLANFGAGNVKNCISNMQMERLSSSFGPTGGRIVRPTDGRAPHSVAFVQCAGSRDQNHLDYCSYICCMASLKQCLYIAEQNPDARITVYYIDLRAPGRYVNVLEKVKAQPNVSFVKGKVAEAVQGRDDKVTLTVEDAVRGEKLTLTHDLVVLATGMQPSLAGDNPQLQLPLDEDGFIAGGEEVGIFAAGCARMPLDVTRTAQSATAAALKAIQTVKGGRRHGQ